MSDDAMTGGAVAVPDDGWLIYKGGRGWYRPNAQGYTNDPAEAGRYSYAMALARSHPNGMDGPRDGMMIKHESQVLGAVRAPDPRDAEIARLKAAVSALRGAISWLEPPFIDDATPEHELRQRIGFCVADAKRAALKGDEK